MRLKIFEFNAFQVNTILVYDESGECVIIDAACYIESEKKEIIDFIENESLKPVKLLFTHCHVDHILGWNTISEYFKIDAEIHKAALPFLDEVVERGLAFGFSIAPINKPTTFLEDGDIIKFGKTALTVLYTPGHADGSVCFVNDESRQVIVGDVLFRGSIGRTDLPTGDFQVLKKSINDKLFTLPEDYEAFPGHGSSTTIGYEKMNNPFVGVG
ncbi:MAG: MBL fold metallo-hydrolase [Bacteroidetes bacterium]|nr:MBL fold metallo-hydrolase [Bacteroidota bacterium]